MLSAPETFMQVCNTTAAIVSKAPAYVTYHVHGVFRAAGESTTDRVVVARSDDGVAIVHDDETGKDELRPAFPAPPTFDALARFRLTGVVSVQVGGKGKKRDGDMRITNVQPLHYEADQSHADAISRSVKGYVVTFAPDATPQLGHLHLERNALMHDTKWLRDIWYDPATLVPSRVVWGGRDDFTLDARYQTVESAWVLRSIAAGGTYHTAMWLGRATVGISGEYDGYAFSQAAPDPRLAPDAAPLRVPGSPAPAPSAGG
jgi:hypothetical protein